MKNRQKIFVLHTYARQTSETEMPNDARNALNTKNCTKEKLKMNWDIKCEQAGGNLKRENR